MRRLLLVFIILAGLYSLLTPYRKQLSVESNKLTGLIESSESLVCFRVSSDVEKAEEYLGPYAILSEVQEVPSEVLGKLKEVLLEPSNSAFDPRVKMAFRPKWAFCFKGGPTVYVSLEPAKWAFAYKDEYFIVDCAPAKESLAEIINELFPR